MMKKWFHGRQGEKGQSFVELGLSLVFLLILLAAVVDLGWAFFTLVALRDAAQEAASVGSICPGNEAKIRERLKASASTPIDMNRVEANRVQIQLLDKNNNNTNTPVLGGSVEVTITYDHEIVTPFVGSFIGAQSYPLVVTVTDKILATDCRIQ